MLSGLIRRHRPFPALALVALVAVVATGGEAGPRSEAASQPRREAGWS